MSRVSALLKILGERPISLHPIYLRITDGCLTSAYLLSQIIYWDGVYQGEEFFNTDKEFSQALELGIKQFRSAKDNLKNLGIILTVLRGIPAKTYYKLNIEKLEILLENAANKQVCLKRQNLFDQNRQTSLPDAEKGQTSLPKKDKLLHRLPTEIIKNTLFESTKRSDSANPFVADAPLPSPEELEKGLRGEPEAKPAKPKRLKAEPAGTQIDPDSLLTPELRLIAHQQGIHESWVGSEFEQFVDYYANPNLCKSKALHVNWDSAWRNWCKNAIRYDKHDKITKPHPTFSSGSYSSQSSESLLSPPSVHPKFQEFLEKNPQVKTFLFEKCSLIEESTRVTIRCLSRFILDKVDFWERDLEGFFGKRVYFEIGSGI